MKKIKTETILFIIGILIILFVAIGLSILMIVYDKPLTARAEDNPYGTPFPMYTTAYYYGDTTASGHPAREGICAVKREWMGLTAIVYADDNGKVGELLGIYECLDTGFGGDADGDGIGSIEEGKVIDIYKPDYESCKEWMKLTGGKVWIQLVDAKG